MPFLFREQEKIMKKVFVFILVSVCAFFTLGICASADAGPKDSVTVYVNGVENGREYYIALIEKRESAGYNDKYTEGQGKVWRTIYEFIRSDGYYFANGHVDSSYYKMNGSDSARWGYNPPFTFKILLYFPDSESFLVSDVLDKYAFDSYFTVNVNEDALTVEKNGGVRGITVEIVGLLIRIALTVLIEIGVALGFGYRGKRALRLILIMNIITQILLNALIAAGDYKLGAFGAILAIIAGEIAVLIVEALVYSAKLPKITEPSTTSTKAFGYAFTANFASFLGGGVLMFVTNLIFRLILKG